MIEALAVCLSSFGCVGRNKRHHSTSPKQSSSSHNERKLIEKFKAGSDPSFFLQSDFDEGYDTYGDEYAALSY
jgi:hypothetical protein